jgi:hypothetical protein
VVLGVAEHLALDALALLPLCVATKNVSSFARCFQGGKRRTKLSPVEKHCYKDALPD